jgi:hypothetical protein
MIGTMKLELTPKQEAWIQAAIMARRFKNEDDARAYLLAIIDDAIQEAASSDGSIEELRRLWDEAEASGPSVDGPKAMAEIWERVQAKRAV